MIIFFSYEHVMRVTVISKFMALSKIIHKMQKFFLADDCLLTRVLIGSTLLAMTLPTYKVSLLQVEFILTSSAEASTEQIERMRVGSSKS